MVYVVVALKAEAQAFVDMYKLTKNKVGQYTLFTDKNIRLIISGLGAVNAQTATKTLIQNFDIDDEDIFCNVGICGASKEYEIGELLEISFVRYNKEIFVLNHRDTKTITCLDYEACEDRYEIVDMESYGFYSACLDCTIVKNRYMFKIVSDNFEPEKVTKEIAKQLIFKKIDEINRIINR